MTVSHALISR